MPAGVIIGLAHHFRPHCIQDHSAGLSLAGVSGDAVLSQAFRNVRGSVTKCEVCRELAKN